MTTLTFPMPLCARLTLSKALTFFFLISMLPLLAIAA